MDAAKLRKTIRTAIVKAGQGSIYTPEVLAEKIATRIEFVLEEEMDEKELNVDYDDIVAHPGPDNPKPRLSDSLAPPPVGTSLIITPDQTERWNAVASSRVKVIPISDPPPQAAAQITLTEEEVKARVAALMQSLTKNTPEELSVVPKGADQPIVLKRQIDSMPGPGLVRVSYRLGVESLSSPSTGGGSNTQPSASAPMAVDTPPLENFSIYEGINPSQGIIDSKLERVLKLAEFIYRKDKGAVVSRTVIRNGPISFDSKAAAHEDV